MKLWTASLNQMAFLVLLILIGYLLVRLGTVEANTGKILSKLETHLFMPAMVMDAFIKRLTVQTVKTSWQFMLAGAVVITVSVFLSVPLGRIFSKDVYERKIYTYGFAFANFGFMGNAVVSSLFPEHFMQYLLFTLPFQVPLYVWAVPHLLIPGASEGVRDIRIVGTKGEIIGNFKKQKFVVQTINPDVPGMFTSEEFDANETDDIDGMTGGHGGGDLRLAADFIDYLLTGRKSIACTEVSVSAIGHKIVFAAERSRKTGKVIKLRTQ